MLISARLGRLEGIPGDRDVMAPVRGFFEFAMASVPEVELPDEKGRIDEPGLASATPADPTG
jgi:hypothetical protein